VSPDHTIREGDSVISDAAVHPKAFDRQAAFPGEVFAQGRFDVVVGSSRSSISEDRHRHAYLAQALADFHGDAGPLAGVL
jgi:hypothetical protein